MHEPIPDSDIEIPGYTIYTTLPEHIVQVNSLKVLNTAGHVPVGSAPPK